jgi:L-ascorbate metabolism protein UlaG (beta-lactamase superfamily)
MSTSAVTYLGHSTLLFDLDGVRLLTDPLLRPQVTFLRRVVPPVDLSVIGDLDAVLISHIHYDHLDIPSLRKLGSGTRLIVPYGAKPILRKHGFDNVEEIRVDERVEVRQVQIQAVPAEHVRSRGPFGRTADCLGYVLRGSASIYFPGDTRLFAAMADFARDVDLALMPVWGWGYNKGKMHMSPRDAAEALQLLRPRLAVPIHWGTYAPVGARLLKPAYISFPPVEFTVWAGQFAPEVRVTVLNPGETLQIV